MATEIPIAARSEPTPPAARWLRCAPSGRSTVVAVPLLWLLLFFLVPFLIVLKISFSTALLAMPPYAPLIEWSGQKIAAIRLHVTNYQLLWSDALYWDSLWYSIRVAAGSTLYCAARLSDGARDRAGCSGACVTCC